MNNTSNQLIIPEITGFGLKGFEDNSDHFRNEFSKNLSKMEIVNKPMDFISDKASSYVQENTFKKVYNTQMSELSWIEKNIYLNSGKEQRLLDERTKSAQKNALLVDAAIFVGSAVIKYGVPYLIDRSKKIKFATSSYQILSYIAATNGQIAKHDQTIIHRVMRDMPVSDKHKKQAKTPIPKTIIEISSCDRESVGEFKAFIGSNAYKIFQNKGYSKDLILKDERPIFEVIGFESHNELKDFLDFAHNDYGKLQIQNYHFQDIMRSIVEDATDAFGRSRDNCIQNSMLLNAYDPFKETRQRNMERIKTGGKIAAEIAINVAQGKEPVSVTAYVLAKHLLFDKNDKNSNEKLQTSYTKSLVKGGINANEVLKYIKQGEDLYKSVR